ncbi:hypothetical protein B0H10DRAFT_1954827 [Mycena sp. CBHHK59/15]|nr:hypothetical protein B0H10DRAFT_1954827 [Mycena sp. CBHHK59/15]
MPADSTDSRDAAGGRATAEVQPPSYDSSVHALAPFVRPRHPFPPRHQCAIVGDGDGDGDGDWDWEDVGVDIVILMVRLSVRVMVATGANSQPLPRFHRFLSYFASRVASTSGREPSGRASLVAHVLVNDGSNLHFSHADVQRPPDGYVAYRPIGVHRLSSRDLAASQRADVVPCGGRCQADTFVRVTSLIALRSSAMKMRGPLGLNWLAVLVRRRGSCAVRTGFDGTADPDGPPLLRIHRSGGQSSTSSRTQAPDGQSLEEHGGGGGGCKGPTVDTSHAPVDIGLMSTSEEVWLWLVTWVHRERSRPSCPTILVTVQVEGLSTSPGGWWADVVRGRAVDGLPVPEFLGAFRLTWWRDANRRVTKALGAPASLCMVSS